MFLAREPALKRTVAVKVLAPHLAADPASRERFEREAQAVAGLSHPNVVAVYAVGELPDRTPYFVMQYVAGRSLAARLEQDGPFSVTETRRILGEVASALASAHAKGIVHRDIKPANILCDEESGRILVSDFGVAAVTLRSEGANDVRLTASGVAVGTPQYMSPEQLLAEPVNERTDVYALGLLGYELLSGASPFPATTPQELIAAHLRDTPRPISEGRADIDAETETLIARCLEKDPSSRPEASEIARRLAPGGGVLLEWPPPGTEHLLGELGRLTRWSWIGATLMLGAVLPMVLAGPGIGVLGPFFGSVLLLVMSVLGLGALAYAARLTIRLGAAAARAVRAGYGWFTILETLADRRGDTGSLITAAGEFGAVPAALRGRLRINRVLEAIVLLSAGALSPILLLAIIILGSAGRGFPTVAWAALLPMAIALLVARHLADVEHRLAKPPSGKRRGWLRGDLSRLSRVWNEGFESVRQGTDVGRGPVRHARLGWIAAFITIGLTVAAGVVLVPLLVVGLVGPSLWERVGSPFIDNAGRRPILTEAARPFAVPVDSSITPLQAGLAFAALNRDDDSLFPQLPHPLLETAPWHEALPPNLFPTARRSDYRGPNNLAILDATPHGFSAAEMAYLERVAHADVWRYFAIVARAPAADLVGRFRLPFPDSLSSVELPIPRFVATRELAYAAAARAAWFLAKGLRDSAETALREVISFGLALEDDGSSLIEGLLGSAMISTGRSTLEEFYAITGNQLGKALRARWDSAAAVVDALVAVQGVARTGTPADPRSFRRKAIATAGDSTAPRGLRMEMLLALGMSPCTNPRELVFGPDEDVRAAFARAREHLARFASDSALLDMLLTNPERARRLPFGTESPGLLGGLLIAGSDIAGGILANRRIAGCTRALVWASM